MRPRGSGRVLAAECSSAAASESSRVPHPFLPSPNVACSHFGARGARFVPRINA